MTQTVIYVSCGEGREIDAFLLDTVSGAVTLRQRLALVGMPVPMRVRADIGRLYVGTREENSVQAFAIDPETGELGPQGGMAAPGAPTYVMCDQALRVVFSASYGDNNLSVFRLDANGIPQAVCQVENSLPRAHAACIDRSGSYVLVPTLGADAIRIYRLTDDLRLVPNDPPVMLVRHGCGPRHLVFSADNRFVYCLNELDGCVDVFDFDVQCGTLSVKQTIDIMPVGFEGQPWAAELRLTEDGHFLFATDRRTSTIVAFTVDLACGRLEVIDRHTTEAQPRGMDIDPTGRWLVVAGQQSNHLTVYAIDPANGRLSERSRHETGSDPICVEIAAI